MPKARPGGRRGKKAFQRQPIPTQRHRFALRPLGAPEREQARQRGDVLPPAPGDWVGSLPEWWVYDWLTRIRHYRDGIDFSYQVKVQGGRLPGGQVADFVLYNRFPYLGLSIAGLYWHAGSSVKLAALNAEIRQLQGMRYDAIVLWEDDLRDRRDYTLTEAVDFNRAVSVRPQAY